MSWNYQTTFKNYFSVNKLPRPRRFCPGPGASRAPPLPRHWSYTWRIRTCWENLLYLVKHAVWKQKQNMNALITSKINTDFSWFTCRHLCGLLLWKINMLASFNRRRRMKAGRFLRSLQQGWSLLTHFSSCDFYEKIKSNKDFLKKVLSTSTEKYD